MMFLGGFTAMEISATPVNSSTTENIEITNAIFDELYIDGDITQGYSTEIPQWGFSTILDAKFKNNILAGNVDFTKAKDASYEYDPAAVAFIPVKEWF